MNNREEHVLLLLDYERRMLDLYLKMGARGFRVLFESCLDRWHSGKC